MSGDVSNVSAADSTAISQARRSNIMGLYTLESSCSTVGGGVGFQAGMHLLVDVTVFVVVDAYKIPPPTVSRKGSILQCFLAPCQLETRLRSYQFQEYHTAVCMQTSQLSRLSWYWRPFKVKIGIIFIKISVHTRGYEVQSSHSLLIPGTWYVCSSAKIAK